MNIHFGILTVSDSCYGGTSSDKSGPSLVQLVSSQSTFTSDVSTKLVPDDQEKIEFALKHWCDEMQVDVILTTGGTGFSPRDVTPEATKNVIQRNANGIAIAMMKASLDITPMAMLSRGIAGTRKNTLIINLPGSVKGATEMATIALPGIPHAVALMRGEDKNVKRVHAELHASHHSGHHCHHSHSKSKVDLSQVARRARESPYPMIKVSKALSMILEEVATLTNVETLSLGDALGLVTTENVTSVNDLPPFPASIKDGYAVITSDGAGLRQVVGNSFAGNQPQVMTLQPGQCMRITTGAAIPSGADAVVQVEDTELVKEADEGKIELEIKILQAPTIGQDIRPVGSDMKKGEMVVEQRTLLQPPQIGLIAAAGVSQVKVFKAPKVAVLSTGDEVQDASTGAPKPGCIYDSNRPMLIALFKQYGFVVVDMGIIRDEPGLVLGKLREAMSTADVVVTSGGVSMGERDYLKQVLLKDLGAQIHFGRVEMKPGKPTTFATCEHEGHKKLVFALPGNPVSAAVTCQLFTLPALRTLAGRANSHRHFTITAKLGSDIHLDPRPEYCRAVLDWPTPPSLDLPTAHLTGRQISSRLLSMQTATALLVLPPASQQLKFLPKGSMVSAILINSI